MDSPRSCANQASPLPGFTRAQLQSRLSTAKQCLAEADIAKLRKYAVERLEWQETDTDLLYHGPLEICRQKLGSGKRYQGSSFVKKTALHALLLQQRTPTEPKDDPAGKSLSRFSLPVNYENKRPHLVLLGQHKTGSMRCHKNPISLENCMVSSVDQTTSGEPDNTLFELSMVRKSTTYRLKAPGRHTCEEWLEVLRSSTKHAGLWRQRRRGLPNIMRLDLAQTTDK